MPPVAAPSHPADPPPAAALLGWYDRHRRVLPWRAAPGETADPYHVWLSEIMLQQTSVTAVMPYYRRFLEAFPTVQQLASAPEEQVLRAWAGLGYYARARNLHACARQVAARGGCPADAPWPQTQALAQAPVDTAGRRLGSVPHVFTHFALTLDVYAGSVARVPAALLEHGFLRPPDALAGEALPSLMRKCLALAAA